jgi:uncharacterized protein
MKIKIHKSYRDVVAICDKDLIGKRFEQGNLQLDVKESFFNGKEVSEKEAMDIMIDMAKEDATFNIIGHKSVKAALKCGLIQKEGIKTIQEIPFALVLG